LPLYFLPPEIRINSCISLNRTGAISPITIGKPPLSHVPSTIPWYTIEHYDDLGGQQTCVFSVPDGGFRHLSVK
jgi:hypothetical protein